MAVGIFKKKRSPFTPICYILKGDYVYVGILQGEWTTTCAFGGVQGITIQDVGY